MHAEEYGEVEAFPHVFFFMHDIVRSTCLWSKTAKHVLNDNLMYRVLKFVFPLTINKDIHFNIILNSIPKPFLQFQYSETQP
jgi:hypothetical protein